MSEHSRRTVVRGAAWSVPVIAVAAQAPAFASSHPQTPPNVNLSGACANTGANNKGCGTTDKSLQIPVTVTNTSAVPIVFQVTSMFTSNGNTAPTAATDPGTFSGVSGIFTTNSTFTENVCGSVVVSNCAGGANDGLTPPASLAVDSVVVAANTTAYFFVLSQETDNSSNFSATITTRLLSVAPGCVPIPGTTATKGTSTAISNNNCD